MLNTKHMLSEKSLNLFWAIIIVFSQRIHVLLILDEYSKPKGSRNTKRSSEMCQKPFWIIIAIVIATYYRQIFMDMKI